MLAIFKNKPFVHRVLKPPDRGNSFMVNGGSSLRSLLRHPHYYRYAGRDGIVIAQHELT